MSSYNIHPTAIVGKECELSEGVEIGPFCVLSGRVKLAKAVRLVANVHICGPASIGESTVLYPGVCIGMPPQDYKFKIGDVTAGVTIGANTLIREHVTIHAATKTDVPTFIGDRVMMMVNSHVGHDSRLDNGVILANGALIAGHARVYENANISGNSAIHQFCRVGRLAFLSGSVGFSADLPPFCVAGARNRISSINLVGMRRAGISRDEITAVRHVYRDVLCRVLPRKETIAILRDKGASSPAIMEIAEFIAGSKRPIAPGVPGRPKADVGEPPTE